MNNSMKIYEALKRASSYLQEHRREEAAARILLQHELGLSHAGLLAGMRDDISSEDFSKFWEKVEKLASGTPVQHLTGTEEFYGRKFLVNKDVLIPRPETEELVEEALRLIPLHLSVEDPKIADIGTGSGIIAVTMKCELPEARVTATDISSPALETAAENARRLKAEVRFEQGNLAEPLADSKWDVVLSNPPYIAHSEAPDLSDTVREYEPHNALFADREGLALYEELADQLPALLNKPGIIGLEIGYTQGQSVKKILESAFPDATVYIKKDINSNDRMVFCING